jgi:tetratricopeptide (TPR) repeat protein
MPCLAEETIVGFMQGRLAPEEIQQVEVHAGACTDCRALLSLALAALPATVAPPDQAPAPAPDPHTLLRGTSFGRYTVLSPVGRGAMGDVYAAYDPELDRKVALKILHARGDGPDGRSRSRLLREAKAIAKLRHPNVVVVHDAGTIDDRAFLAMEYVEGRTLADWLAERARTREEILEVFVAAARGLAAAHAVGLAHRDFKPQNVMVGNDGGIRVTDFGLAREFGADDSAPVAAQGPRPRVDDDVLPARTAALPITRAGEIVGTPLYMAPEQFLARVADARSDQFGFCVALYQALYGVHPFGGKKLRELITAVTTGLVQPPPTRTAVPTWLRRVLLRGLSVDPAARWESMEALIAALSRDPARQRRRWLGGVAVAAGLAAAFVAVRAPRTAESLCRGGPARFASAWEPDDGSPDAPTRRAATRAAFLKTGIGSAADTWERTARLLDRYRADWLRMYGETCTATHLGGKQSNEVLDLRMACLDERLGRVNALTDVFLHANPTVLANAVTATSALPSLARCADAKLLRAVVPPPDDPAVHARVEALRRDLARTKALNDSGQCAAADEARRKLVAGADALGYLPLQADCLTATIRSDGCVGDEAAIQSFRRAALLGMASHHYEAAAEAAMYLATLYADRMQDVARGRDWIDVASAIMQRISGNHPVLETWRLKALAVVFAKEGDTEKALDTIRRGLTLIEQTQGKEHLDYASAWSDLGTILEDAGRFEESLGAYRRAAELAGKVGGRDHPLTGMTMVNSAGSLNLLHRYSEARLAAEEALRILRHSGSSAFHQGYTLAMLGEALIGEGRPREAALRLEEALDLLRRDPTPYQQTAELALARALAALAASRRSR